jgi:glycosyltransferase involved in cell wall biosynthesis
VLERVEQAGQQLRPVSGGYDDGERRLPLVRVVVVSAWEPWRQGDGACLVLHAHLRELAERHTIEVLAAGADQPRAPLPAEAATLPEEVRVRWYGRSLPARVDGVARRLRRGDEPAHVGYVGRAALRADLAHLLAADPPDVVHLYGWGTAPLVEIARGLPTVHDAIDPWTTNVANRRVGLAHRLLDPREQARALHHERRWYPRVGLVSLRTAEDVAELGDLVPAARFAVLPNGVEAGPEPRLDARGPVLAFLGAYDARSNVEAAGVLVREVLPRVRLRHPEATALLIGRDPPPELTALAGPTVTVTGRVQDVRPHLEAAAVFVAPMRSGRGVKNKVLEAMAAGLPVVASGMALHGIGSSAGVRRADTADDITEAVHGWLHDESARQAAGRANRELVRTQHTWARSAAVLESLWETVACGSTS